MADTKTYEEERQQTTAPEPQYSNLWDEFLKEDEKKLQQQEADDRARIEQLSKGRQYWIGANMFANALGNLINVYGTRHGAPAMQMPQMDNSYMKVWKESDDLRRANYQRMKDHYDRLRLGKMQRDQQIDDMRKSDEKARQLRNEGYEREDAKRQEAIERADNERKEGIANIMEVFKDYDVTEKEAAWMYDNKGQKLPRIEKQLRDEEYDKKIKYADHVAANKGSGNSKDYDLLVGSITIHSNTPSEEAAKRGEVSSIVKKYVEKLVTNPGPYPDISNLKTDDEKSKAYSDFQKAKEAYDQYKKSYGNYKTLSKDQIAELVNRYGLNEDTAFMNEINAVAGKQSESEDDAPWLYK